ncbi:MAG: MoaD/ThiS family protein [Promethearchaeota archaeon]|jgi:molybdopterin converting factor small subunit
MSNYKITVTVKFFAMLREYGPTKEVISVPVNSTIKLLFKRYHIPKEAWRTIIIINGSPHKDLETVLRDGDIVSIFPPIGGG